MDHLNARRILRLEQQLEIWEDKLNDFRIDQARAEGPNERFAIKRRIEDEINPEIKKIYAQYSTLIRDIEVTEAEAKPILAELIKVTEDADIHFPDPLQQKLDAILQETKALNKSATARLKVALPIIPLLVNYELSLDTENLFYEIWRKVRGLLKKRVDSVNP